MLVSCQHITKCVKCGAKDFFVDSICFGIGITFSERECTNPDCDGKRHTVTSNIPKYSSIGKPVALPKEALNREAGN